MCCYDMLTLVDIANEAHAMSIQEEGGWGTASIMCGHLSNLGL